MAVVVSNYNAGSAIDVDGECPLVSQGEPATLSSFRWTIYDAIAEDPEPEPAPEPEDELIIGGPAPSLAACQDAFCTGCSETWYASDPSAIYYMCTDYTRYVYKNRCRRGGELCGADDKCHKGYPSGDTSKTRSADFICRPLPERLEIGDFEYSTRKCRANNGLCPYGGCRRKDCRRSWPVGDEDRMKSDDMMCRCMP